MIIAVDGFGGDNAPLAPLQGAALAVAEYGVEILMTGDQEILEKTAKEHQIDLKNITFVHTTDVISMCDEPTSILKEHKESSLAVAFGLVKDGKADAIVSAGSTGAIVVGASLIVRRIKGVKRPTIGTVIPCQDGAYLLVDGGANVDCRPDMLAQFGLMGAIYMEKIMGIQNPRVGLVNVGTEESKGRELQQETFALLKQSSLNFVGNIEARQVPLGGADVVVADGFTGNVILKLTEGLAKFLMGEIKALFMGSTAGKLAAMLVMKSMKTFKKKLDYKEHGGAPLIGASKTVIKAHGSSDGYALKNAIRQARACVDADIVGAITKALETQKQAAE